MKPNQSIVPAALSFFLLVCPPLAAQVVRATPGQEATVRASILQMAAESATPAARQSALAAIKRLGKPAQGPLLDLERADILAEKQVWQQFKQRKAAKAPPEELQKLERESLLLRLRISAELHGLAAVTPAAELDWLDQFPALPRPEAEATANEALDNLLQDRIRDLEQAVGRPLREAGGSRPPTAGDLVVTPGDFVMCGDFRAMKTLLSAMDATKYDDAGLVYDRLASDGRCFPVKQGVRGRLLEPNPEGFKAVWRLELLTGPRKGQKVWASTSTLKPVVNAAEN